MKHSINDRYVLGSTLLIGVLASCVQGQDSLTREAASDSLRRAVAFFRNEVSSEGGYLWRYSSDLSRQEGEGSATPSTAWVQPPGTPSVGAAFLFAHECTGDEYYLEAARETARALVRGQLESGGWDYRIEFAAAARKKYRYRADEDRPDASNTTTLDDDTTQSALRFLMRVDQALDFKDEQIHGCIEYAWTRLIKAQYPNGAWPQRFSQPPIPEQHPVHRASFPDSWSRTYSGQNYRGHYTFNDNSIADMIETLMRAAETYNKPQYRQAAEKAGDFILLAQMPKPQPAWAQQYNAEMHPAWARRFEPPAVTGGESQGIIRVLMQLYRRTGRKKYLAPIPAALEYLEQSRLPNGQLARFYELKTNRPLYFTKQYELTYSDADMPTHYGFKVGSNLDALGKEYRQLLRTKPADLRSERQRSNFRMSRGLAEDARTVVRDLDERGAWIDKGSLRSYGDDDPTTHLIDSRTFVRNVGVLSRFIAASQ